MRFSSTMLLLISFRVVTSSKEQCCRDRGVSDVCSKALCDPSNPPDDMKIYKLFDQRNDCQRYLKDISICITEERDSSECCQSNAIRKDQSSCFEYCKGSGSTEGWRQFQSCFAINLSPMYECIKAGYTNTPTPPINVKIVSKTTTSVKLKWDLPKENGNLAHLYKVHLIETSGKTHQEVLHDIKNTQITIDNLQPDGKYFVFVVAHAKDISRKSMPSLMVHFNTFTNADSGVVFKDEVKLPRGAKSVILSCHLRQGVVSRKHMVWQKKDRGTYRRVVGSRFHVTTYANDRDGLLHYVSALEISRLEDTDFGLYKCHLDGETNDYGEVKLVASSYSESRQPSSPPETPVECCSKSVTRPHCQSICSGNPDKKRDIKPGAFLPQFRCMDEFSTLLRCTLQDMNNVACCIRKRVPYHCLGMCDANYMMDKFIYTDCLNHLDKVYTCQHDRRELLPEAVSKLSATTEGDTVSLQWDKSLDSEVYHIYHRQEKGEWQTAQTTRTEVTIKSADEIVVLATNKYGHSGAARIAYENEEWIDNYV